MRIAIIGADTFVGARLVESFHLGEGPTVVAVAERLASVVALRRFAIDLRAADPLDPDAMRAALQGCTAAIHVQTGGPGRIKPMAATLSRALVKSSVRRLIYLSSAAVLGRNPPTGTTEQTRIPAGELDPVAAEQLEAERLLLKESKRLDIATYALRPSIVYGARSELFAEMAAELRDERAWLVGKGDAVFNGIYVDNLITAMRLCLKAKAGSGEAFLVGDAETVTWRDLYHAIARELDFAASRIRYVDADVQAMTPVAAAISARLRGASASVPGTIAARAALQQSTHKIGFVAAAKTLGYTPAVSFDEAIHRTCAWWRFAQGDFYAAA